ncbi:DUF4920 domain-containing protein [Parvicella tangerina]|uniref:DUF4920 domain-containing protein n=1 Tax=Parvicella tangerina TaxID=2829795 RepID=A0A916NU78_9FLAO|nr:DUF4920 domain-containing protein [Parvicella tangerina]CAG5087539.1 hypothetical protein CRYO30217_03508 [Parvicella tangerina]
MKKLIYITAAVGFAFTACSEQAPETETSNEPHTKQEVADNETTDTPEVVMVDGYAYYGIEEMTPEGAVSVEEMNAIVDSTGGFEGKVKAQLGGVCQKAGCWVTIVNPGEEEEIRVFFGEHDFVVPIDTELGKEVILQGKTDIDTFTVEFQKHLLDDEAASGNEVPQSAYDAITEDKIETSFIATAILIKS